MTDRDPSPLGRLSVMMFLQYAVWGAWLPLASNYLKGPRAEGGLGFSEDDVGLIVGTAGSFGAVLAPFIAGQFADRWFRTERFLGTVLLLGGALQWWIAGRTEVSEWLVIAGLYSVLFMPTLALSNSLAFAHLTDRTRQFPKVRVWGTIGWIAASWIFPMIWLQHDLRLGWMPPFLTGPELPDVTARYADAFRFSAILSVIYGIYAFTLPATPPRRDAIERFAVGKAFALLRKPSFALLVIASLPIAMIHTIYFLQAGPFFKSIGIAPSAVGPVMTAGQFSEIILIALLGLLLKRAGFRTVLALGAFAYFLRYWIWSIESISVPAAVASQALHGACYAFFFAAAYIYVDRVAPPDVRHSAQTLFGVLILGGGPIVAGIWLNGWLAARNTVAGVLDFHGFFFELSLFGLGVAILLALCFRDQAPRASGEPGAS